jgi:fatty acid amide hydrolase
MGNEAPTDSDLTLIPAVEIARRVAAGETSAVAVLDAYLARIESLNPRLNAIITPTYDSARVTARHIDELRRRGEPLGPLAGVPMTIKDSYDVVDTPTTIGIGSRRRDLATGEGPVVERLRRAGAVIVGKTNVPQIMLMFETDNRAFGRTPHPENVARGPGGSSGGEAAAVAARLSAVGLGSDLLGSIRQPAHACGIHGFKPSINRASRLGSLNTLAGMEAIVAQPGPLARHMSDVVAVARVLIQEPYDDPLAVPYLWREPQDVDVGKLRVGVWDDDAMFTPAPAVRRAVREAAQALRSAGADIVPMAPPDTEEAFRICVGLLAAAGGDNARKFLDGEKPMPGVARMLRVWGMSSQVRGAFCRTFEALGQPWRAKLVRWSRKCRTNEYWNLVHESRQYIRRAINAWRSAEVDVLLCPPHGLPALRHGTSSDTITSAVYLFVTSLLGVPSGTVAVTRVGAEEESNRPASKEHVAKTSRFVEQGSMGLPVGVQVSALPGRDQVCLAVMQALESYFSTKPDYPPKSVPTK